MCGVYKMNKPLPGFLNFSDFMINSLMFHTLNFVMAHLLL